MDYEDNELIEMINESSEDVKDAIYSRFEYIIDIIMQKYKTAIYASKLDYDEVKQEAYLAFSKALTSYNSEKDTSIKTYIYMVIRRRLNNILRNSNSHKRKSSPIIVSLEDNEEMQLLNVIKDETYEPLKLIENKEKLEIINKKIKEILSPFELEVFNLLQKDLNYIEISDLLENDQKKIDNTIQRIRRKLRDLLKKL